MRPSKTVIVFALLLGALALTAIVGCATSTYVPNPSSGSGVTASGGIPVPTSTAGAQTKTYSSPGERIYLTGVGADGQVILREAPKESQGALLMGGGGCASCHGTDGHGGTIQVMTGPAIKAPNITYADLIKNGFADTTIRNAVRYCTDETGAVLDPAMPCWQMSDADVNATLAYLKTLK